MLRDPVALASRPYAGQAAGAAAFDAALATLAMIAPLRGNRLTPREPSQEPPSRKLIAKRSRCTSQIVGAFSSC